MEEQQLQGHFVADILFGAFLQPDEMWPYGEDIPTFQVVQTVAHLN